MAGGNRRTKRSFDRITDPPAYPLITGIRHCHGDHAAIFATEVPAQCQVACGRSACFGTHRNWQESSVGHRACRRGGYPPRSWSMEFGPGLRDPRPDADASRQVDAEWQSGFCEPCRCRTGGLGVEARDRDVGMVGEPHERRRSSGRLRFVAITCRFYVRRRSRHRLSIAL
jgi:hypothetical protein